MRDYEPNSHKYKAEKKEREKRLSKVTSGPIKTKHKSGFRKFADEYIFNNVVDLRSFLIGEVLVPTIKDAIADSVNMVLYGKKKKNTYSGGISYRDYYESKNDRHIAKYNKSSTKASEIVDKNIYSYEDIVFPTKGEAENVLDHMQAAIEKYDNVSIGDLFDLIGESCDYTKYKYGWTALGSAETMRVREGYILKLPKARPLD